MSELKQKQSGLYVFEDPPKDQREYGPLEIKDPEMREQATKAMKELWEAMGCYNPGSGIRLPGSINDAAVVERLFHYFNREILGPDCPEFEQLC